MEVDEQEAPEDAEADEACHEEEEDWDKSSWQEAPRHWQATGSKDEYKTDGYQSYAYADLRPRAKQRW